MKNKPLQQTIWGDVRLDELVRKIHEEMPVMPDHVCGLAGLVSKESGKFSELALSSKYKSLSKGDKEAGDVREEMRVQALRVAAMAISVFKSIK